MVIGIDIGSTTTKVAAINRITEIIRIKTKAMDAITSATGAFGKPDSWKIISGWIV